jgi:hypothetical protein
VDRLPYHCLRVLVDEFTERANGVWTWKALEAQEDVFEFLAAVVVVDQLDVQAVVGADRHSGERFMSLRTAQPAVQVVPNSGELLVTATQIAVRRCRKAERPFGDAPPFSL